MILVIKNTLNNLTVTASENATIQPLSSVTYLWQVKNKGTNQSKTFILANGSSAQTRYDMFKLTESDTENLTGGTVSLQVGDYDYYIYQQSSSTNLDVQQAGLLLEQGLMVVMGTSQFGYSFDSESTFKLN